MNSVNGSVSCFLDNVRQSTASMRVTRASGKCFSVSRSKWFQRRVAVDRLMHRSGGDMALFCFFLKRGYQEPMRTVRSQNCNTWGSWDTIITVLP